MRIGLRLKRVRKGLNLTQEELAFQLSLSQTYLSLLENNRRDIAINFYDPLIAHLAIPCSRTFGDRLASRFSPLAKLPGGSRTSEVLGQLFSEDITCEEWVERFERLIWPLSKQPYEDSEILRVRGYADKTLGIGLPPQEAIDHDVLLHGEDYVRGLALYLTDSQTSESDQWKRTCHRAYSTVQLLLEDIVELATRQDEELPHLDERLEIAVEDLDENFGMILPRDWKNKSIEPASSAPPWNTEAFAYGMDFAAILWDTLDHPDLGQLYDRARFIGERLDQWRAWRRDSATMSDSTLQDLIGRNRRNMMEVAIEDFRQRNKKRRGRPRKNQNG